MYSWYNIIDLHKNYRDTLLESDAVTDEEETLIQSFIDEDSETVPGSSTQYSSANDPYASITYTDLTDEIKLVTDLKCFTYRTACSARWNEVSSEWV